MNKTLLERQPNNKRIATTESLQKRFFNGSKNHVMEIEKLMCHHSATKERINFGTAILFLIFFISLVIRREEWPTVRRLPPFGMRATMVWYSCYQAVVLGRLPGGTALKKRDGKVLAVGEAKEIIACVF